MPLLSYEGVEVDLPADLAGIRFEFTAGSLTIRCCNFTGDVVLSKRTLSCNNCFHSTLNRYAHATAAGNESSSRTPSPTKKRTIDLSASDNDEEDVDAKRQRPNFLNEAEQTLLLAQLNSPDSLNSSQKAKSKGKKTKKQLETDDAAVMDDTEQANDSADSATTGKTGKKTPSKKSKKNASSAKVDAFFSPDSKQLTSLKPTPDSTKKRDKTPKASTSKSIKEMIFGPPKPKPAGALIERFSPRERSITYVDDVVAAVKWEMVEALGDVPPERWGTTATKISEERVVLYGGTDDDERTLGDLHVFDMKTHRWSTPLNCETITRTWHDAVYLSSKNLVLVFGGERNSNAEGELDLLSDIMLLDTECFLWYPPAVQGSPPSARSGHTCTAIGNDIVVFGGSRGRNRQSSVHILNSGK
ncbi:Acyl-CoA-binding domain-containing protein 4 [Phytophthora citrophthora]|uniref:Acyl-CoA-binding domain-containing protein 4 n=1 Tax=Phytophthora citrophthora TaxID=4793 RepID=A0AAD9LQX2_9STRA|nr:Acyl-CoA-binding domain-containing protein 4 [Phytophthora citrophthora]